MTNKPIKADNPDGFYAHCYVDGVLQEAVRFETEEERQKAFQDLIERMRQVRSEQR